MEDQTAGEKVVWCETHKVQAMPSESKCWYIEAWGYQRNGECRFVERLLVPIPE